VAPADPLIGAILDGRYRVVERLAEGAMGVVYRGERTKLHRAVAVKFLQAELADEPARRQRFEVEARAMARLDHPHCAAVIDVGLHAGMPYVVMDYVRGDNLRNVIDAGALDPPRAVAIMKQILSGLAHAHELGIFHRDIKPANVMLADRTGLGEQVRILDFGLARLRDQESALTAGVVIGTPAYMAPEQCTGGLIDGGTDLYACGVLLFEMLTGDKPFDADQAVEILRHQLHSTPPRLPPSFGALGDVVARALAKAPADRYGSAAEMIAALDAATGAAVATPPPVSPLGAVALPPPPSAAVATHWSWRVWVAQHRREVTIGGAVLAIVLIGLIARCAGA
jgi:serine/threonine-protein kinase